MRFHFFIIGPAVVAALAVASFPSSNARSLAGKKTTRKTTKSKKSNNGNPEIEMFDVVVVGAGLTGTYAAWQLEKKGMSVQVSFGFLSSRATQFLFLLLLKVSLFNKHRSINIGSGEYGSRRW